MDENQELYCYEIIARDDDVIYLATSLNEEKETIFAAQLDDGGVVYELEYATLRNIKSMVVNNNYIFIKRTKI